MYDKASYLQLPLKWFRGQTYFIMCVYVKSKRKNDRCGWLLSWEMWKGEYRHSFCNYSNFSVKAEISKWIVKKKNMDILCNIEQTPRSIK